MELLEGSETSAFRTQMPGNYPKENILHKEHGESVQLLPNLTQKLCMNSGCHHSVREVFTLLGYNTAFVFVFIIFPLILIGYNILGYGNSQ